MLDVCTRIYTLAKSTNATKDRNSNLFIIDRLDNVFVVSLFSSSVESSLPTWLSCTSFIMARAGVDFCYKLEDSSVFLRRQFELAACARYYASIHTRKHLFKLVHAFRRELDPPPGANRGMDLRFMGFPANEYSWRYRSYRHVFRYT